MPSSFPTQHRAACLGVGWRSTPHEATAALVGTIILLVNVTSVWVFIVFVQSVSALQARSAVTLPVPRRDATTSSESRLVISVHADDSIWVDGAPVPLESLAAEVKRRAPQRVLLKADQRVRYPQLKLILPELGRGGATNVTFSIDAQN